LSTVNLYSREYEEVDGEFLAWLAGFWEGEGTFRVRRGRYPYFDISQSGERGRKILEEIRDRLGVGYVKVEPRRSVNHEDRYRWIITETGDVVRVVEMLLPYMRFRRDEVEGKLAVLKRVTRRRCRRWSREDVEFLVGNYPKMTREEIAKAVGRTVWAVRSKIQELGLRKFKRRKWTGEDVEAIRRLISQGYSYRQIAEILGVSRSAVFHKWHRVRGGLC
jgi:transposase-like protein